MKIFLVGLPGSGKTTIGKELAKKLGTLFIDLDAAIEAQEKKNIQEIFKVNSESYFRKIESAVLKQLSQSAEDFVMATGGGAPCFFDNMETINKSGKSIFLDISAKEIARRIKRSNLNKRPLFENLHDEELKDKIEFLRSQRIPFYQKAHLHLKGEEIQVNELLKLLE